MKKNQRIVIANILRYWEECERDILLVKWWQLFELIVAYRTNTLPWNLIEERKRKKISRRGIDIGIDCANFRRHVAIQCKYYGPTSFVKLDKLTNFLYAANKITKRRKKIQLHCLNESRISREYSNDYTIVRYDSKEIELDFFNIIERHFK